MPGLLKHKAIIMIASVIIVIATYFLASGMETELMTADDTGTVSVSIETRPGLLSENADAMLTQAEEIVKVIRMWNHTCCAITMTAVP